MIFMKTDIGQTRSSNQDAMSAGFLDERTCWAVVCDGMGGANGGSVASQKCIELLSEQLQEGYRPELSKEEIRSLLEGAIYHANAVIYELAQTNSELSGMGTTAVLALVQEQELSVVHVGDSRAMLFHAGTIQRLTKDHSLVQHMIDVGELTEQEAQQHPNRHVITRAIGVSPVVLDDYGQWSLQPGDVLLLCSDGLYNRVSDQEIALLLKETQREQWAEKLVEKANENGGEDNITAVLLCIDASQEAG